MQIAKEDGPSQAATPMQDSYRNFHNPSPPTSHFWDDPLDLETRSAQRPLSSIVPTRARSLSASPPCLQVLPKCKAPPSPQTIVHPSKKVRFMKAEALTFANLLLVPDAKIDRH